MIQSSTVNMLKYRKQYHFLVDITFILYKIYIDYKTVV